MKEGFNMCVICYIPKNKNITRKNIEDMFFTNPDGAGFMYSDGKKVYFKKGFLMWINLRMNFLQFHKTTNVWHISELLPVAG